MTDRELETVARALRTALGYGSRTERIQRLLHNADGDVCFLASQMKYRGILLENTVNVSPVKRSDITR